MSKTAVALPVIAGWTRNLVLDFRTPRDFFSRTGQDGDNVFLQYDRLFPNCKAFKHFPDISVIIVSTMRAASVTTFVVRLIVITIRVYRRRGLD
jgi:hypothetical protein